MVYAIRVNYLTYGGLKIHDVKIGKTTNIKSTLAQYKRSNRDVKILDLWKSNDALSLSECERGAHQLAEKYASERESEKFVFLQESYEDFSKNLSQLLGRTTEGKAEEKGKKIRKKKISEYIGKKPKSMIFQGKHYKVKTWRDVLGTLAKEIYEEKSDFDKVLKIRGRKRDYFAKNPGHDLVQPKEIPGTSYCFEGNISANRTMKIVNDLLDSFGHGRSDLKVYFED